MGDLGARLSSLAQVAQPQQTQPQQGAGNDLTSRLKSVAENGMGDPNRDPHEPFKIQEEDRGAMAGLARTGKNLLEMPANLYHAIFDDYRDDTEKQKADAMSTAIQAIHGTPVPSRIALVLNRLVADPMIREQEKADAYDKIAHENYTDADWKKEPNRVKRALKYSVGEFSGNDVANEANHKANVHHIASMVPLLGPIAGDIMDHYMQGDKSGAVSELLANIAGGKALEVAGGKIVKKVAPQVRQIAGQDVPVLASQTGSKTASGAEALTKATGHAGEHQLTQFTERQAADLQKAVGNIAGKSAGETGAALDAATNPLSMSLEEFNKLTDSKAALAKSGSFGEAANNIKAAAGDHFRMIDQATDGEFSTLKAQREAAFRELRNPNSDPVAVKQKLADIAKAEDGMFTKHGIDDGKTSLGAARDAWKKASTMEELDSRINRVTDTMLGDAGVDAPLQRQVKGAGLLKQLEQMDPKDLKLAVGSADHIADLKKIGALLQNGQNVAKVSTALKFLRASRVFGVFHHPLAIASTEGLSYVMGKVLTSPTMAGKLARGLKAGASAPVIANVIAESGKDTEGESKQ